MNWIALVIGAMPFAYIGGALIYIYMQMSKVKTSLAMAEARLNAAEKKLAEIEELLELLDEFEQ